MDKYVVKRILIAAFLVIVVIAAAGCGKTVTDEYGVEHKMMGGFVKIREVGEREFNEYASVVCYDPATKVCYVVTEGHGLGVSPYYVIGADGTPEIAVYGVNYR